MYGMNKIFLPVLLSVILFSSCGGADPVAYNNNLAGYYKDSDGYMSEFYNTAKRLLKDNKLSELPQYAKSSVGNINGCIEKVENLNGPDDSEEYRKAMITYMEAQIAYIKTMSEGYSQLTDSTSEADFERIESAITRSAEDRMKKNDAVMEAHAAFALKHNLKITKSESK